MFFYASVILADYFKISNENLYLGIKDGYLKLVEKPYAADFERKSVAAKNKTLTGLFVDGSRAVTFNSLDEARVEQFIPGDDNSAFQIALDLNGKFFLISSHKCLYAKGRDLKRGNCGNSSEVSYFQISKRLDRKYMKKLETIKIGNKADGFNPEDPLANGTNKFELKDEDISRILLPYRERLAGQPNVPLADPAGTPRLLVKFDIF